MSGQVDVVRDGPIGRLIFNNPDKRNAINVAMNRAATAAFAEFSTDPAIRVVVMSGAGEKSFVSGADMSEFDRIRADAEQAKNFSRQALALFDGLRLLGKPTIASIRGACIGGGVVLAACCDFRLCADDAIFSITAAKLGLGYTLELTLPLVQLVGQVHAKDILLTGRRIAAAEAAAMGLVNTIVPPADLASEVDRLALVLADNAPLTLRALKNNVAQSLLSPEARDIALTQKLIDACADSADYAEGRRALAEKRKPVFRGE